MQLEKLYFKFQLHLHTSWLFYIFKWINLDIYLYNQGTLQELVKTLIRGETLFLGIFGVDTGKPWHLNHSLKQVRETDLGPKQASVNPPLQREGELRKERTTFSFLQRQKCPSSPALDSRPHVPLVLWLQNFHWTRRPVLEPCPCSHIFTSISPDSKTRHFSVIEVSLCARGSSPQYRRPF